ncbi:dihydrolipoyl dehydrogenase [Salipaludibacillus daqingensis]|uniref:dihydrolipoyl dehydrogenase n=1 Tax=Salipaludibacillus daqingensis TaxID=3041001 RepID=UPI002475B3CB|nr:dihydrolipoyl dehydrogenase [Salipaludibacillus daqingensis]
MVEKCEVVIIGTGPGGYVAAIRAAQHGKQVTVIEKAAVGGTCLNVGCIPSKALITAGHHFQNMKHGGKMGLHAESAYVNMQEVQTWKQGIVTQLTQGVKYLLKGNGVETIEGTAKFSGPNTIDVTQTNGDVKSLTFEHCIIATGSRPIDLPGLPWGQRILSSTEALALNEIPEKIAIVGGGYIGIELGTVYAQLGSHVTIIEGTASLLPGFEQSMVTLVENKLNKLGNIDIYTNAKVQKATEQEDTVTLQFQIGGKTHETEATVAFITVGRKPNTDHLGLGKIEVDVDDRGFILINERCATSQSGIFAVGDVCDGPALAHRASFQGKVAADNIGGHDVIDEQVIPSVVFSDPELASVGLSFDQAKKQGYQAAKTSFPFAANGRAMTFNDTDGFVQLVVDENDGSILGAQIAGPSASELINELTLAVQSQLTIEDLSLVVHFHPSLGESIMEAAELAMGHPIHMLK